MRFGDIDHVELHLVLVGLGVFVLAHDLTTKGASVIGAEDWRHRLAYLGHTDLAFLLRSEISANSSLVRLEFSIQNLSGSSMGICREENP